MSNVSWNAEYRRWSGQSVGVWHRRLSIARYGLRLCLSGKIMRAFLLLAFAQTFVLAGVFFFLGQIVAEDSALIRWIESLGGEDARRVLSGIASWALLYPEISVDGVYRVMFYALTFTNPLASIVIVALFIHRLVAHDLASQAIVIYNSKALTCWDYIIGKFAIVATILSVMWILPVVCSWLLGNMLAPDWSFFYHTFPSLMRGLAIGVAAVLSLSCVAMLVSSLAKKTGAAVAYWIVGIFALNMVSGALSLAHPVFAYIDPFNALEALAAGTFRMQSFLIDASTMLPFFGNMFSEVSEFAESPDSPITDGARVLPLLALAAISAASIFVVNRRVRPQ